MSIIEQAKIELKAANFGEDDSRVMIEILEKFLDQWDSGGAVASVQPVFNKLLAGKPLTPIMGTADEWFDHGDGLFQNKRCSSIFKDPRFHDGKLAYDLDNPAGSRAAITFPYTPARAEVQMPIFEIEID